MSRIDHNKLMFMDESGVDNRLYREYARAPRGEKVIGNVPGKRSERVSMIGALSNGQFIAPFSFKGSCNQIVVNEWLSKCLLPLLSKGYTIVMDNARFHKSPDTKKIIKDAQCHLMFLPTYSPDLNPIEHCWHTLKTKLRPLIQHNTDNPQELVNKALLTI